MKRIVLTGGGTAGHVTPNLALIPPLQRDGWEVHYIGSEDGIERKLVSQLPGVTYHAIKVGKLRRYADIRNLTDPFRVIQGVFQAAALMKRIAPAIVFAKGGFVSVPVVYGARMRKVPVLIHESDMTPGLANRLSAPFAKKLLCTFPEAARLAGKKGVAVGTPLRPELFKGNREAGRKLFGFQSGRPVLMVVGGSTGAQSVNRALRLALPKLLDCFQVLHLCGAGNLDASLEGTPGYCQKEYLNHEISHAYAVADVLISRAGSNTLSEILALNKPSLLIPYPLSASRGDQVMNARSFEQRGLARVLMQEDMTPDVLASRVIEVYKERGSLIDAMEREPSGDGMAGVLKYIEEYAKV
ncbi:undecaprenyldiphospho-muramoylpentapeptide beta-N-acetylglucosaminyltransferase [Bacillota bacterium Meth-B3]|nr:undecaprenyldiphospho-muramoylpentapeptide beta-N-acetylglucosaminyltransferase [Christensenellaceae bacterium]MEA5065450.1 undecaprenyldiphospho-muramoylpentapeptide beta-N-acetylglucosaminyltransferase [Eubacteriales bacterium]MEA5069146.1 undecaprenyldiphospho-muramoylpentapeptide beta-N-acetylglucosaminyltransferase [Christensenellaceae bacterium]